MPDPTREGRAACLASRAQHHEFRYTYDSAGMRSRLRRPRAFKGIKSSIRGADAALNPPESCALQFSAYSLKLVQIMDIEMCDQDKSLYLKLYVREDDLQEAIGDARHIRAKGWTTPSFLRLQSVPMHQRAFTAALIISYGRACKPQKKPTFPPDGVLDFSDSEDSLHRRLIHFRDKVTAHSDSSMFEVNPMILSGLRTHRVIFPYPHFSQTELDTFLRMAARVQGNMRACRKTLLVRYISEIDADILMNT